VFVLRLFCPKVQSWRRCDSSGGTIPLRLIGFGLLRLGRVFCLRRVRFASRPTCTFFVEVIFGAPTATEVFLLCRTDLILLLDVFFPVHLLWASGARGANQVRCLFLKPSPMHPSDLRETPRIWTSTFFGAAPVLPYLLIWPFPPVRPLCATCL